MTEIYTRVGWNYSSAPMQRVTFDLPLIKAIVLAKEPIVLLRVHSL